MEPIHSPIPSQERLAGVIASIPFLFFAPHLMDIRTDFTTCFMRQGFGLTLIVILISIVERIPFFGIFEIFDLGVLVAFSYLAWNSWKGNKLILPYLFEYTNKAIETLGIGSFFIRK